MRGRVWFLAVVCALCVVASVSAASEEEQDMETRMPVHPQRIPGRSEDRLESSLSDRASLLFRSMDKDHDKLISEADVHASASQLAEHMPGIHPEEFMAFLQMADKDGDSKLSREELMNGLADGLNEAQSVVEDTANIPPELLETETATFRRHRRTQEQDQDQEQEQQQGQETDAQDRAERMRFSQGIFGAIKNVVGNGVNFLKNKLGQAKRKVTGGVDSKEDGCVMCQYIVERCEGNVKQSGVLPSMAAAEGFGAYLEVESSALPDNAATSLLEVQSEQFYGDGAAATIIGSARQSTRVQRQLERQKYNEIYRVVDITLDDVCEQGMPNSFYGFCKQIYKVQSDVVDGLRYQYRPADICFRVGVCGKSSYITKGKHSRYKKN